MVKRVERKEFSVQIRADYVRGSDDVFEGEIQVELAIDEADVIILLLMLRGNYPNG
jgi:hypothetical protein